jgi:hypothetical protein
MNPWRKRKRNLLRRHRRPAIGHIRRERARLAKLALLEAAQNELLRVVTKDRITKEFYEPNT